MRTSRGPSRYMSRDRPPDREPPAAQKIERSRRPELRTWASEQDAPDQHKRPLCAQALCAGPSLHDRASDKSGRSHNGPNNPENISRKRREGKRREKSIPALRWTLCRLADAGALLLHGEKAAAHTTRTQSTSQRRTNDHARCDAGSSKPRAHRLIQQCPQLADSRSPINSIFGILSNADEREGGGEFSNGRALTTTPHT